MTTAKSTATLTTITNGTERTTIKVKRSVKNANKDIILDTSINAGHYQEIV